MLLPCVADEWHSVCENIICHKTGAGLFVDGMYIYVKEDFLLVLQLTQVKVLCHVMEKLEAIYQQVHCT